MTQQEAREYALEWFDTLTAPNDMPLFQTDVDCVTPTLSDRGGLQRSTNLTSELKRIRKTVRPSQSQPSASLPEGILYFIYRRQNEAIVDPLYVGIAECVGKNGTLSALFKTGWMRFDHRPNSNGHIGRLTEAVSDKAHAYSAWVQSMFLPTEEKIVLTLKSPIFVKILLWDEHCRSAYSKLGHTPLYVEEKLRLWILRASGYGGGLLNRDGNRTLR